MAERHELWMTQYGRVYYKDETEKASRLNIFKENVEFIESFNKEGTRSYKIAVNKFADLTNEEFREVRNGYKESHFCRKSPSFMYQNVSAIPATMDWRKKGAVTEIEIKDQGQCAVATMERIKQLSTGKLISFSEQELVDCNTSEDQGCNEGLTIEANYPYEAANRTCNSKKKSNRAATISSIEDIFENSEVNLLKAVANQSVFVAIDVGGSAFQFYSSSVFTNDYNINLDHGVIVIGYGNTVHETKYWLVKNSWEIS
ncbi:hypothetical protein M9H77_04121 [Catharanthus roseus]|uniref:Uncharacterized protein n=1 Tax=Catharanthus roseus TaxID=4058 RepID=A0ACC0CDL4_CATRO|nr:hypothetical protein M9H77_04121 [Catharanthus roseus]